MIHRQWSLEEGVVLPLGRSVQRDHLLIDWDPQVAPRHAVTTWKEGRLHVDRCSDLPATQPIFFAGREAESFQLVPGEGFVIGRTAFRLDPGAGGTTPAGPTKLTHFYAAEQVHTMTFHPTEEQLAAVRDLLFAMESNQTDLEAFARLVVSTIRRVIRSTSYVAVLGIHG
ncbi:MAG TPA: hypothetical protein VKH44_07200, partial [Pirellulaceae bacterium]|nr:hypothetical protein [Pirellulaceae bacterium]